MPYLGAEDSSGRSKVNSCSTLCCSSTIGVLVVGSKFTVMFSMQTLLLSLGVFVTEAATELICGACMEERGSGVWV